MNMLRTGQLLVSGDGQVIEVGRLLGEGGQAEVYEVTVDAQRYALKWYHVPGSAQQRRWAEEQRDALVDYLLPNAPPDSRFLWPLAMADGPQGRTFGYLMHLLPARFQGLEALVLGKMKPSPGFKVLCQAAIGLAECFRKLHNMGACYKDINLGGAFIDPTNGDVRVCDTDNVRVNKTPGNIIFVYFAAPELVRGESTCQTNTDIHSLAVLLFYMFIRHHPLAGARELRVNVFNEAAQRKFYGRDPLFVYDPDDADNRPVPGFHDPAIRNWKLYPQFLRDAFTRAFTVGLHEPDRRVREGEWMEIMSRLRDCIFYCTACGSENFLDPDAPGFDVGSEVTCWRCRQPTTLPAMLELGDRRVMINHDTVFFGHHLGARLDFSEPKAEVTQHPNHLRRWGIRNLSDRTWTYEAREGEPRTVEPGRAVGLRNGLVIDFGVVKGKVRTPGQ